LGVQKGMGLGLAICYSIIKKHDGFIDVESSMEAGTKVSIYLPAAMNDNNLLLSEVPA
jgi:signal transduction histidine kinase